VPWWQCARSCAAVHGVQFGLVPQQVELVRRGGARAVPPCTPVRTGRAAGARWLSSCRSGSIYLYAPQVTATVAVTLAPGKRLRFYLLLGNESNLSAPRSAPPDREPQTAPKEISTGPGTAHQKRSR
jgi:hypothetical protein